jgi:hypothetical protein
MCFLSPEREVFVERRMNFQLSCMGTVQTKEQSANTKNPGRGSNFWCKLCFQERSSGTLFRVAIYIAWFVDCKVTANSHKQDL